MNTSLISKRNLQFVKPLAAAAENPAVRLQTAPNGDLLWKVHIVPEEVAFFFSFYIFFQQTNCISPRPIPASRTSPAKKRKRLKKKKKKKEHVRSLSSFWTDREQKATGLLGERLSSAANGCRPPRRLISITKGVYGRDSHRRTNNPPLLPLPLHLDRRWWRSGRRKRKEEEE